MAVYLGSNQVNMRGGQSGGSMDADIELSLNTKQMAATLTDLIATYSTETGTDMSASQERWMDIGSNGGTQADLTEAICFLFMDLMDSLTG